MGSGDFDGAGGVCRRQVPRALASWPTDQLGTVG